MNSRKMTKLLILTITSLLIAGASAQVYNYMYMSATVGVEATGMSFVAGADFAEAGGVLSDNDQRVTFSTMNGVPGQLVTYPDPVKINNADTDPLGHDIELVCTSWDDLGSTKLHNVTITMYNATNSPQGASLVLNPAGGSILTSGDVNIGNSTAWRVEWKVWWTGNAVVGTDSMQVSLELIVKS